MPLMLFNHSTIHHSMSSITISFIWHCIIPASAHYRCSKWGKIMCFVPGVWSTTTSPHRRQLLCVCVWSIRIMRLIGLRDLTWFFMWKWRTTHTHTHTHTHRDSRDTHSWSSDRLNGGLRPADGLHSSKKKSAAQCECGALRKKVK